MREKKEFKKESEFESKLLGLSRVERMTAGGRRLRFQAVMVVGDKKNRVGVGTAKAGDVSQAIEKATKMAQKRMIEVPIVNETIPQDTEAKYGAARVLLRPQRKGRGLVAGGTVRIICSLAGIRNVSAKIIGRTNNKLSNAKATIKALNELKKDATTPTKTE
jgi:small subunit ribosomal protein S5